jgi:hypothetical protein
VRERIDALVDAGSFVEVGALAGAAATTSGKLIDFTPSNLVFGRARIEQRPQWWSVTTSRCAAAPAMVQWRQDDRRRENGARLARADRAAGRRHRRWRLGEDHRAEGLHAAAQGARVADVTRCLATVPVVGLGSARWPGSVPRAWRRATTA